MKISAFWFRRDLRLIDNHGLYEAIKSGKKVLCFFIFDRNILNGLPDKKDARIHFIFQQVRQLKLQLNNIGSDLMIAYDYPDKAWIKWITQFDIETIFLNRDYEPYAVQRDDLLNEICHKKGIILKAYKDHVLFEKSEVLKEDQTTYTVFTPYSKIWKNKYHQIENSQFQKEANFSNLLKVSPFLIPELADIGFEKTNVFYTKPTVDITTIQEYEKTRNIPALEQGTSMMSVHLRFGTVSIRELASIAQQHNEQWLNELIWREFFMSILMHFPKVESQSFKKQYDEIQWRNNEDEFAAWCEGRTGFPIVDAGMRQLNQTGLMHNRVRMIAASFLCKDLLIDWRWGEAYFAQKLLDYDLSANNGNWQWAAGCGCDAAPYFRIFNPTNQTKQYDPELIYVKRWVKDLNDFTYPQPIVEHAVARERTLRTYKQALNS